MYYDPNDPPIGAGLIDGPADRKSEGADPNAGKLPKNKFPGDVFTQDGIKYTVQLDENDRLAQFEVSDKANDEAIYGVFQNWNEDLAGDNSTSLHGLGLSFVRVTGPCKTGDLITSKGDGTAVVQSDNIIRSYTVGKVTIGKPNAGSSDENLVTCILYCG